MRRVSADVFTGVSVPDVSDKCAYGTGKSSGRKQGNHPKGKRQIPAAEGPAGRRGVPDTQDRQPSGLAEAERPWTGLYYLARRWGY